MIVSTIEQTKNQKKLKTSITQITKFVMMTKKNMKIMYEQVIK